jgi:hypothetical protein
MSSEFFKKSLNLFSLKGLLRTPCLAGPGPDRGRGRQANPEPRTYGLDRRLFLRGLIGLPFFWSFPFYAREAKADLLNLPQIRRGDSISEFFKGEELVYEIGVWIFKRVALGTLTFKEMRGKGRYMAILQAETLGILGWVARYRVDTYCSIMEEVEGGRRLRSLSFEEDVKIGSKVMKRIHLFDYQKRKWVQMKRRKDGVMVRTEEEIPPGMVYDDFLTASYNFRYGVYGAIERGKKYSVATFPRKGSSSYELTVAGKEEEENRRRSESSKDGKDFYLKLYLDPAITHSKEGLIEGWLSKETYPLEGAIKDVILFGDVTGRLIKNTRG